MAQNIASPGGNGPPTALTGLTVNGVPIINSGGAPFFTGRWIFCNAVTGSDGNAGTADFPVQTLTQAYSLTTSGNNDVVVLVGNGGTTATQRLSATLTWANNATHLIGQTAPSLNQRARISTPTTATVNINPLMTISGSGCYFGNFSFFQGVGQASTDEKLIDITGSRNVFDTIDFGGMGHANGAARAGSYIIKLDGAGENRFINCNVGLETVQRSAANASVVLTTAGAQRNQFLGCTFMMAASATSPLFFDLSAAGCLNGSSMLVQNCLLQNLTGISAASNPAVVATANAAINGVLLFDKCTTNATKYAAATSQIIVSGFALGNGFSSGVFATAANS
jgi:hypothetical protein